MAANSIVRHVVSSTDTLDGLAYMYRGSTDDWQVIVDFNQLDEPYITNDPYFVATQSAAGLVVFTRPSGSSTSAALTIPAGTLVSVPISDELPTPKVYKVLTDTTMPAGKSSVLAYVQCTAPGDWGNCSAGDIKTVSYGANAAVTALLVTNPAAFANGRILNVKQPGDIILVPTDATVTTSVQVKSSDDYLALIGGTDLALTPDGSFMVDAYGDLADVSGMDNMMDAAATRIGTEYGELVLHPDFGCGAKSIIGEPNMSIRTLLMGVEVQRALLADDRFIDVQPGTIMIQGNQASLSPTITISTGQQQKVGAITI